MQNIRRWAALLCAVLILCGSVHAQEKIDSLEQALKQAGAEESLDILIALGKEYWSVSPQKGLDCSTRAADLARSLGDQSREARALLYGGVNAWFAGTFDLSIEYYQKSLAIAEANSDKRLVAYNLNNLGMVTSHLGNYQKAIDYYSKASLIMKELNDEIEYAKIINNIGKLNFLLGDYREALENQLSILDLVRKSDERTFLLWLLSDIGTLYSRLNDADKAQHYFGRALTLSKEIDDQVGRSIAMRNLGMIALSKRDFAVAGQHLEQSLKLALNSAAKKEIQENYRNLAEYYEMLGRHQKALENYKWYKAYSDSVLNESKISAIVEMETKYETESKEKENRLLRKNNEIKRLEIEKQTYLRNFLIALLLVSVIITLVVMNQVRTIKELNTALNEKNGLLEKTVQEKTEALERNELLLKEMNHRVKNNLAVIQSLLNLQSHQMSDAESRSILRDSAARVKAVSRIHAVLSQKVNLREMAVNDYISRLIRDLAANFDIDESRIKIDLKLENICLDVNVMVPFALILNELITNVFKYAFPGRPEGQLLVSLAAVDENQIELIVKDNGAGLPEGFSIDRPGSLGMEIVASLVDQISGTLKYESPDQQGTEFRLLFPNRV